MLLKLFHTIKYLVYLFLILELFSRLFFSSKTGAEYIKRIPSNTAGELRWLRRHTNSNQIYYSFDQFDQTLGWTLKPNLRNIPVFSNKILNSNSHGIRGSKEYVYGPSPKKRIICLGDSLTFGDEVSDNETWPAYLQKWLPSAEIINLGVHGYGHDQMLLYFRKEGVKYSPHIVLLGFIYDDTARNLLGFKDYFKPKFSLTARGLKLKGPPLISPQKYQKRARYRSAFIDLLSIIFYKYRELTGQTENAAEKISDAILSELVREIRRIGAIPVFIYLSNGQEWHDTPNGLSRGEKFFFDFCGKQNVICLSTKPAFIKDDGNGPQPSGTGHWSPEEHRMAAQAVLHLLLERPELQAGLP